jgi:hypothetical protein
VTVLGPPSQKRGWKNMSIGARGTVASPEPVRAHHRAPAIARGQRCLRHGWARLCRAARCRQCLS